VRSAPAPSRLGRRNQPATLARDVDTKIRLLGLLTRESAADLTVNAKDEDCAAVHLPMSCALGGFMVLVPRSALTPLALSAEDLMRTALTAGMSAEHVEEAPHGQSRPLPPVAREHQPV
jgi:uncharacterized membrane protein